MVFSRRSAQSCTCDDATASSSPMRANEAIDAPPEHVRISGFSRPVQPASLGSCNSRDPCYLHPTKRRRQGLGSSNIGTTFDYRRLDAEGQRVRCLSVNEELSD